MMKKLVSTFRWGLRSNQDEMESYVGSSTEYRVVHQLLSRRVKQPRHCSTWDCNQRNRTSPTNRQRAFAPTLPLIPPRIDIDLSFTVLRTQQSFSSNQEN
jgi:hypothetical protein